MRMAKAHLLVLLVLARLRFHLLYFDVIRFATLHEQIVVALTQLQYLIKQAHSHTYT